MRAFYRFVGHRPGDVFPVFHYRWDQKSAEALLRELVERYRWLSLQVVERRRDGTESIWWEQ